MENWKEIDGTDGRLFVSDQGRVKSLLRDGKILKATPDKKGYLRLRVTIDRRKHSFKVHRLVAMAFVENPGGKPQVNHINGDKTDNRACNLEWVSNAENARHAIRTGLWETVIEGSRRENNRRKRKIVGISPDGEEKQFQSIGDAERYLNSRHITDVLKGKRQHVKYWKFKYIGEEVIA